MGLMMLELPVEISGEIKKKKGILNAFPKDFPLTVLDH